MFACRAFCETTNPKRITCWTLYHTHIYIYTYTAIKKLLLLFQKVLLRDFFSLFWRLVIIYHYPLLPRPAATSSAAPVNPLPDENPGNFSRNSVGRSRISFFDKYLRKWLVQLWEPSDFFYLFFFFSKTKSPGSEHISSQSIPVERVLVCVLGKTRWYLIKTNDRKNRTRRRCKL